ncbi:sensor histidine kinase [Saccharopolyspora sp. NPDC050642]|uniref:ATP-binding protein n=1 Tax=Saccharopolyspora sp. NPDC050642 TaxID=3157099 RepID=UPI0033DCE04A
MDAPSGRRQLAVDTGLAMLVLVVVGTAITANVGGSEPPGVGAYGFSALFAVLMLVRRRWPVGTLLVTTVALLAYYVLSYPPIGLAVPVAAALYSAAEQGRLRIASGVAVALLLISTVARLRTGDDPAFVLGFEFTSSAGLMAAVIALGDSVRSRRGWRAELERQARAAELEQEREAARRVEQERLRIARDLHDLLAHTTSVISLHTDVARESLRDDPDAAERSLVAARGACSDMVQELRTTVRALRDPEDPDTAIEGLDQLDVLLHPVRAAGIDVQVRAEGEPRRLPVIADGTAYRVVQEALSNVLRHSGAGSVTVELGYRTAELALRISDDGRGADLGAARGGWGIIGMRERLALLGGDLRVSSRPDGGFVVEAHVPLAEQP